MSRGGSADQKLDRTLKLTPFHLKAGEPHPEEWTLVGVHKIEKREPFNGWYTDLQANILSCANQINNLLEKHPHPNANLTREEVLQSRYIIASETDRVNCDVISRHPGPEKPAFFHLYPHEEIRLYKGL